jgi:hypothetical protein
MAPNLIHGVSRNIQDKTSQGDERTLTFEFGPASIGVMLISVAVAWGMANRKQYLAVTGNVSPVVRECFSLHLSIMQMKPELSLHLVRRPRVG